MNKIFSCSKLKLVLLVLVCSNMAFAEYTPKDTLIFSNPAIKYKEWFIKGFRRQAGLYVPATIPTEGVPVVIVWHGFNNLIENFMTNVFNMHTAWPEAMVIYPQGLVIEPGTDKNGTGWSTGSTSTDLDLLDSMLITLKKEYHIDESRIYTAGFSNGAMFSYYLWEKRGDVFAAFGPVAGFSYNPDKLVPKPFIQVAGKNDTTVPYSIQVSCVDNLLTRFNCSSIGTKFNNAQYCTEFKSDTYEGLSVVTYYHPNAHVVPSGAEDQITAFFKQHQKNPGTGIDQITKNKTDIFIYYDNKTDRICLSNLFENVAALKLIDLTGRILSIVHSNQNSATFEMNKFNNSVYFVQVAFTDGTNTILKVIRSR